MSRYEILPNVLWKVENLWCNDKKCSGILSFLGMSWKLKLLFLPESGGVKVKLILKRLSAVTFSQDTNFNVETCLLKQHGSGDHFRQNLYASLGYREWCVWSQFKSDVEKQDSVYYRNTIVFLVVITPGDKWPTLLQGSYKKKADMLDVSPCLKFLSGDLEKMFDDSHSDVVLVSGGREFRAHRALLSARSEVFEAMFRCDMRESREGKIEVTDVEPDVLGQFLIYLYTGDVPNLDARTARKLHVVADKYSVDALKMRCAFAVIDSYRSGVETQLPRSNQPVTYITESEKVELRKKELTKDVLVSKEWRALCTEFPKLAADMCAPLMVPAKEPPPTTPEEKMETSTTKEDQKKTEDVKVHAT